MRVLGYDPYISEAAAKEMQVELVPLEKLLAESDFISLHTAVSPATQNLINAKTLAQMKKGAWLINAARGELIDEGALAEALKSGHLAGAALDVFVEEPTKNTALVALPNVLATPHIAGSTTEAQEEVGTQVAVQVRDYLADGVIRNAVNLPALSPDQYRRGRPYLALAERLGLDGGAGGGFETGAHSNSLRGRSCGGRDEFAAKRGAGGIAERGARREGERGERTAGCDGARI